MIPAEIEFVTLFEELFHAWRSMTRSSPTFPCQVGVSSSNGDRPLAVACDRLLCRDTCFLAGIGFLLYQKFAAFEGFVKEKLPTLTDW